MYTLRFNNQEITLGGVYCEQAALAQAYTAMIECGCEEVAVYEDNRLLTIIDNDMA